MKLVNIYNNRRTIYLFCRDDKGNLSIKEDNSFFPYFYEPDKEGKNKSYTGIPLKKVFVSTPSEVPKTRSDEAFEADVLFVRRYMLDKVKKIEKCPIKYTFIDIEVLADELPNVKEAKHTISCISAYNSLYKSIQTWYLGDFKTEYEMINNFIEYLQKEKFDLWMSWNVKFDYNYLVNRFPDFIEKISPVNKSRYGDGEVYYPAGISIIDYLTWFKKVTLNRRKSYALDYIAQKDLKEQSIGKIEFGKLTPEIKKKNRKDIERMVKLEEKFKLIEYYDEIRRLSKVEWEDMIWNSRIIDTLLLEEAKTQKVALPMKPDETRGTLSEKEEYLGAYREVFQTGAFFGVTKYDLGAAYPKAIIDFCLDPANICTVPLDSPTKEGDIRIEKTVFRQNPDAILPTVVKKLITLKNEIKVKLSTDKDVKIKYDAIKTIVNSAYGVFGNRFFRLYDKRVASATTYLVRSLLHYVKDKIEEKGYKVIYVDTDSVFIDTKQNLTEMLNSLVTDWAKEKYGKDVTVKFGYEGIFEKLLILTKCRYVGYIEKKGKIEEEMKGVEAKRKDSTEFMKKFQKELILKILDKHEKATIIDWIKSEIKRIRTQSLKDIAFPCKLARQVEEYKNVPIFVRALQNTSNFKKKIGDPFYYIYVKPDGEQDVKTLIYVDGELVESLNKNLSRKEGIEFLMTTRQLLRDKNCKIQVLHQKSKPKDVKAFDEDNYAHINRDTVDWELMIKRNIWMKLSVIFEAMNWDLKNLLEEVK